MNVIDISQPLGAESTSWPGDQPFELLASMRRSEGGSVNLNAMHTSTHTGTHLDAPFHASDAGATIDELSLQPLIGPATLVEIPSGAEHIRPAHVARALANGSGAERVLFKTRVSEAPTHAWSDDFPALLPETVEAMAAAGVVLVGTDAASVDPAGSTELPAHRALIQHSILNLENLCLVGVPPGAYWLVALPLRIQGGDASPVRAALLRPGDAPP